MIIGFLFGVALYPDFSSSSADLFYSPLGGACFDNI